MLYTLASIRALVKACFVPHSRLTAVILWFFGLGLVWGFFLSAEAQAALLEQFIEKVNGMDTAGFGLFVDIFFNNLFVSLLLILLGWTMVMPVAVLFANGLTIGVILDLYWQTLPFTPASLLFLVAALAPHGIFELPAFFLSAAVGMLLGLKLIAKKKIFPDRPFKRLAREMGLVFVFAIIPLLLVAGVVEAFVTAPTADWVSQFIVPIDPDLGGADAMPNE